MFLTLETVVFYTNPSALTPGGAVGVVVTVK